MMSYVAQPHDFSFIGRAGQMAGETVRGYVKAKNTEIDDKQAKEAYKQLINEATGIVKDNVPEINDVTATSMAVKYFIPKMKSETATEAVSRWASSDAAFKKAVDELKLKKTRESIISEQGAYTPQGRTVLEGRVSAGVPTGGQGAPAPTQVSTPEEARSARLAGRFTGTTGAAPIQVSEQPEAAQLPGKSAAEIRQIIDQRGLTGNEQMEALYKQQLNKESVTPTGNRAQAMAGQLQQIGGWTPEQKEMLGAVPTEKDIMTDETRRAIADENARLREEYNKISRLRVNLYGQRLTADQRMDIVAERRKNQEARDKNKEKIANITARIADKDYFGSLDETSKESVRKTLGELRLSNDIYDEIDEEYNGLLKEKGGIKKVGGERPKTSKAKIISVEQIEQK